MTTRNDGHVSEEAGESSDDEVAVLPLGAEFSKVWDPIAAMMWISQMEHIFELMKCADKNKVKYGVSMFRSEARVWWDRVKDTSGATTPTMTWSRFKEVFKDEFYPLRVELELVHQYRTVKRESDESLQEYTDKYRKLSWFFSHYLATPEKRLIYLYVGGLTTDIKAVISESDMTTLDKAMKAARVINDRIIEERRERERRKCTSCGKKHGGVCRYGSNECYRCGKLGHLARECRSA